MRTAFVEALCEIAQANERVWLLTADLGFSVLERFAQQFPKRYLNVGVAEQNATGIAAGLAMSGKIVLTYSIANFPTLRCLEQIRNDVCYHQANVKVVAVGGGYTYGPQGYTHHGIEELAILRTLPGMTVVAPGDPVEARLATKAIVEQPGPCYLRLGKAGEPLVYKTAPAFALGKAVVAREGSDVTFITTGGMLKEAVDAAATLAGKGIDARVLSMHTLKPLDEEAVFTAVRETAGVITVEEHTAVGGLGSAVADALVCAGVRNYRFKKLAVPDRIFSFAGSQAYFRAAIGDLVQAAEAMVKA